MPANIDSTVDGCNAVTTIQGPFVSFAGQEIVLNPGSTQFNLEGTSLSWSGTGSTEGFPATYFWPYGDFSTMFVQDLKVIVDGVPAGTFTPGPAVTNATALSPLDAIAELPDYESHWSGNITDLSALCY